MLDMWKSLELHERSQMRTVLFKVIERDVADPLGGSHRFGVRHGPTGPRGAAHEAGRYRHTDSAVVLLDIYKPHGEAAALAETLHFVDEWLFAVRRKHEVRLEGVEHEAVGHGFVGG